MLLIHAAALAPALWPGPWQAPERLVWAGAVLGGLARALWQHAWPGRGGAPRSVLLRADGSLKLAVGDRALRVQVVDSRVIGPFVSLRWRAGRRRRTLILARDAVADWRGLRRAVYRLSASVGT